MEGAGYWIGREFGHCCHWPSLRCRAAMWRLTAVQAVMASSDSFSILRIHTFDPLRTYWIWKAVVQERRANRRCAALSRSVQRPKGARLRAMLWLILVSYCFLLER